MTRSECLTVIATWPTEAREAFGHRANALTPPGLIGWREAEFRAFEEVSARLAAGEFAAAVPPPSSTVRTSRRAPAPGQAGLGFEAQAERGA